MNVNSVQQIIKFASYASKLKMLKRTGWTNYPQIKQVESVADHSYRLSLLTLLFQNEKQFDISKCMKYAILHDLAEAIVGDITPSMNISVEVKYQKEFEALKEILDSLDHHVKQDLFETWIQYEKQEDQESQLVKDLDKEQKSQHNVNLRPNIINNFKKKKIDKGNFQAKNLENKRVIKMPGSLNGGQFAIDNCKNCEVYIFDHTSFVTIDDTENCKIFIGPSESSVFVRTTKNSKLMICCKQFRSRDCYNLQTGLYSQTQPVIESSDKMQFFCFQYNYKGFKEQFDKAKLQIWNNNWSDLYDFTPKINQVHFSYLSENIDLNDFMPLPNPQQLSLYSDQIQQNTLQTQQNGTFQYPEKNPYDDSEYDDELFSESYYENLDNIQSQNLQLDQKPSDQVQSSSGSGSSGQTEYIKKKDLIFPITKGLRKIEDNQILYYFKPYITQNNYIEKLQPLVKLFNSSNQIYLKRSTIQIINEEQEIEGSLEGFLGQNMLFMLIGSQLDYSDIENIFFSWINKCGFKKEQILEKQFYGKEIQRLSKIIFENWNDERKKQQQ